MRFETSEPFQAVRSGFDPLNFRLPPRVVFSQSHDLNFMKNFLLSLSMVPCLLAPALSHADAVYGGIGFPGVTIGYDHSLSSSVSVRGEYSGGLKLSRDGRREGVDFQGELKANSLGVLADFYPSPASGFRATGGVTFNDTKASLVAAGNNASAQINGKPVNLNGQTYSVDLKYPRATPYLGIGYNSLHNGSNAKGWGFFIDAGLTVGKFNTSTTTTLVGVQGITQADIDAQTSKVRDGVSKLSVLPKLTAGVAYAF